MRNYLKKLINKVSGGPIFKSEYYSQCGEDAILYGIFYKKIKKGEKGSFVDVGAYHPVVFSNTYFFYKLGWRGINIDARPGSMRNFRKKRSGDVNLEIGIGKKSGTATFYILNKNSTMNTFSKNNLEQHNMLNLVKKEVQVEISTLEAVLDRHHKNQEIDFLNVDAEGMDLKVLKSNNWFKYQPKVIVVEIQCRDLNDVRDQETSRYLLELGYKIIAKNIISSNLASVFFVLKEYDY